MAKRQLQALPEFDAESADLVQFHLRDEVDSRWNFALQAEGDDRTVSIQGVIGYPEWAEGTTAKMVEQRLKELGQGDITVNINSPGGDFFHGQAMHNLLRAHDGKVVVQIIGVAASAASVVAMAGDEILIPKTGWLMIHNVWGITLGNRHDHAQAIRAMEKMDAVSADLYAERSGKTFRAVQTLMDDETYFGGQEAVDAGFADRLMNDGKVKASGKKQAISANAKAMLEQAAKAGGMSRSQFRATIAQIGPGTPRAAVEGKPRAADALPGVSQAISNATKASEAMPSAESLFKKGA